MAKIEVNPVHQASWSLTGQQWTLFFLVLVAVLPFMHYWGGQQASRYAATAALWDLGTLEVTEYAGNIYSDGASVEGSLYSDKAPGQPLFAVPAYGAYRIVGGPPMSAGTSDPDWGLWWVTVWSAGLPLAALAVLMYRWALQEEPNTALAATLTLVFGSLLLVYGTLLFGHVLAAVLGFSMFLLVRRSEASNLTLVAAGLLGGLAVLVEYPMALIVGIVSVAGFLAHRARGWLVIAGGLPAVLALGFYNTLLFGGPLVFSYQWNIFSGIREEAQGTFDILRGPSSERFLHVLFSERGLLITTPIVLLALVGVVLMWRRGRRLDAAVALFAFLSMLAIQFAWANSYAGGAGPRYVTPGLPFLVAPLAVAWSRWRLLATGSAVVGVLTAVSAVATNPQLSSDFHAGLNYWLRELWAGQLAPTVYTETLGPWGWALHVGTVLGAGYLLLKSSRRGPSNREAFKFAEVSRT